MQILEITTADVLLSMYMLNRHCKTLPTPNRAGIYALKERLCQRLCELGYCTGAELEVPAEPDYDWQVVMTFESEGTIISFHLPRSRVNWPIEECEPPTFAPLRADVKLCPREVGALVKLVARWLNEGVH